MNFINDAFNAKRIFIFLLTNFLDYISTGDKIVGRVGSLFF